MNESMNECSSSHFQCENSMHSFEGIVTIHTSQPHAHVHIMLCNSHKERKACKSETFTNDMTLEDLVILLNLKFLI